MQRLPALACAALLAACSGGGSARTALPGVVPAQGGPVPSHGAGRKPESVPSCTGTLGTGAFVGGGFENVAHGAYSGCTRKATRTRSATKIARSAAATTTSSRAAQNTSYYSWIGSGYDNSISGNGYQSVIGGGNVNAITAPNSFIGGGNQNNLSGSDSVIAGGSTNTINSSAMFGAIGGGSTNTSRPSTASSARERTTRLGQGRLHRFRRLQHGVGRGRRRRRRLQQHCVRHVRDDPGRLREHRRRHVQLRRRARASAAQTGTFVWSDGSDGDTILTVDASLSVPRARVRRVHALHQRRRAPSARSSLPARGRGPR